MRRTWPWPELTIESLRYVAHPWIVECLDLFGVADNIRKQGKAADSRSRERHLPGGFFVALTFFLCPSLIALSQVLRKSQYNY